MQGRRVGVLACVATLFGVALWTFGASASEKGIDAAALEHYFVIQKALASDNPAPVAKAAEALARPGHGPVAEAARKLAAAKDLPAMRKAFGALSKAVIEAVHEAHAAGHKIGPVYLFECPMAKPYGRWLQKDRTLRNPYYGKKMLSCGKPVSMEGQHGKGKHDGGHHGPGQHGGGHHGH